MTEKLDMGAPDCQGVEKETNVPLFFLRDGAWVRAGSSQTPLWLFQLLSTEHPVGAWRHTWCKGMSVGFPQL